MFLEVENVGLKDPKYELAAFMTRITIDRNVSSGKGGNETINEAINEAINEDAYYGYERSH